MCQEFLDLCPTNLPTWVVGWRAALRRASAAEAALGRRVEIEGPRGQRTVCALFALPELHRFALEEIGRLRTLFSTACDRIAAQSELLSRCAQRRPSPEGVL